MNYNMNLQKSLFNTKHSKTKSQIVVPSSSSDYSTCSDNPQMNMHWSKQNLELSRESDILAGHIRSNQSNFDTVLEDTNFSISPLDLNLDVLNSENDDIFTDCRDFSSSESGNDSTMYLQLGKVFDSKESQSDVSNNNSSSNKTCIDKQVIPDESKDLTSITEKLQERLITIIEEREVTSTTNSHIIKDLSNHNNTDQLTAKMVDHFNIHDALNIHNNNLTKKVLFADKDNVDKNQNNKLEFKKNLKPSNNCAGRFMHKERKESNIYNHNTTESFVLWEKFCEASEKPVPRRSFSFSDLNSVTETCSGDDEYSTSYKTLEDIYLSGSPVEVNYSKCHQQNSMIFRRSKSCESILSEVKHLPHLLYDRFLKCLSKEIEKIRKQNVVCTCQKHRKNSNKENERKYPKNSTIKLTNKVTDTKSSKTETKSPLKTPTLVGIRTQKKLSPRTTDKTKLSPEIRNQPRLSPEENRTKLSPDMASKNSSQNRYFWNKQIVSPVGEYIRGKRQSPFKNSPSKKK